MPQQRPQFATSPTTEAMLVALAGIKQEEQQRRLVDRETRAEQANARDLAKRPAAEPTAQAPPATEEDTSSSQSSSEQQHVPAESVNDSEMVGGEPAPTDSRDGAGEQHLGTAAETEHPPQEAADRLMSEEEFWERLEQQLAQEAWAALNTQDSPQPPTSGPVHPQGIHTALDSAADPHTADPAAAESTRSAQEHPAPALTSNTQQNYVPQQPAHTEADDPDEALFAALERAVALEAPGSALLASSYLSQDLQELEVRRQAPGHVHHYLYFTAPVHPLPCVSIQLASVDLCQHPSVIQVWHPQLRALCAAPTCAAFSHIAA